MKGCGDNPVFLIMDKCSSPTEYHIEASTSALENDHGDKLTKRHGKQANVQSVALADAIAKDQPNYKSLSQFKLYAMMAFCVLSVCLETYCNFSNEEPR